MSINDIKYNGGENFDLRQILLNGKNKCLNDRTKYFENFIQGLVNRKEMQHLRIISSAADRKVLVKDLYSGELKEMLMFGSNNYLGLSNHPIVIEQTQKALNEYGAGIGGPPLLNGYSNLHKRLEQRIASLKNCEDALIFSSGYGANVGLISALVSKRDTVLYDAFCHASFFDGLKMTGVESQKFTHNDTDNLEELLQSATKSSTNDIYVCVEGVYSMDGDLAPLQKIVSLCKVYGAILVVDDAHGTGIMGINGSGTAEHFNVQNSVDITMGTFSKAFGAVGGFIAGSKALINYLRFFARSYMFSASLPPVVVASILAGLDVIEREPQLLFNLRSNISYMSKKIQEFGINLNPQTPIFALRVPVDLNIRKASYHFHENGIFVNSIEYPAVPINQQRFRISLMANHTTEDLDCLISCIGKIWSDVRSPNDKLLVA